jgi:hypothetical protein
MHLVMGCLGTRLDHQLVDVDVFGARERPEGTQPAQRKVLFPESTKRMVGH